MKSASITFSTASSVFFRLIFFRCRRRRHCCVLVHTDETTTYAIESSLWEGFAIQMENVIFSIVLDFGVQATFIIRPASYMNIWNADERFQNIAFATYVHAEYGQQPALQQKDRMLMLDVFFYKIFLRTKDSSNTYPIIYFLVSLSWRMLRAALLIWHQYYPYVAKGNHGMKSYYWAIPAKMNKSKTTTCKNSHKHSRLDCHHKRK